MTLSFAHALDGPVSPSLLGRAFTRANAISSKSRVFDAGQNADVAAQEGADVGSLDLQPGQTSFAARVRNLIEAGRPGAAVTKLQEALSASTPQSIDGVLDVADRALSLMQDRSCRAEAAQLTSILSAWTMDPPRSRPETAGPVLSPGPSFVM